MSDWGPGRIACVVIAGILALVIVSGVILCKYHGRIGQKVRRRRELDRRCRSLVRKERDLESMGTGGSFSSGSGVGSACSGCSDSECWGRTIVREHKFGSTLALPAPAYDPDLAKVQRLNDKERIGGW